MLIYRYRLCFDSAGPPILLTEACWLSILRRTAIIKRRCTHFTFYKFRSMYHKSRRCHSSRIHRSLHSHDLALMASFSRRKLSKETNTNSTGIAASLASEGFCERPAWMNCRNFGTFSKARMSLVGPRPAIPYEVELYEPWHMHRLATMPGLTGLWQVTARNSATFDDMVRMDLEYIAKQSFWLDMKILIKTPLAVIDRKCN